MPETMTVLLGVLAGFAAVVAGLVLFSVWTAWRVEKVLPPRGKFLQLTGARIHYLERGSGRAIVMVHGLGGQSANFDYGLVDELAREYRVIAVDRPGAGYSTRESDDSARLRTQAAIVADFIRKLGLDRPLVVGHSLGGAIALAVALDFPDAVGSLALLAPLTHVPKQVPAPFRPLDIPSKLVRRVVSWTLGVPIGIRRGPAIVKMIFAPEAVPKDFATRGGGLLSLRPSNFYNVSTDLVAADADLPGMIEQYPMIRVPVAILYGTSDEVLDYREHGEAMKAKIANLRLQFVEGGHMLPVTRPELAAEFIRESARVMCAPPRETTEA